MTDAPPGDDAPPADETPPAQLPFPTLADVFSARRRIAGAAVATPLVASALSARAGAEVLLKLETCQTTGAFKFRGAMNAVAALDEAAAARGVACASTGNHGRGVAEAARRRAIPCTVCLSSLVPEEKVRGVKAAGARVVRAGGSQDEAFAEVDRLAREEGVTPISPFDDPLVVAGQGTIGLEIMEARPDVDTLVVPLSGGGLVAGVAMAAKAIRPDVRVVGVSMEAGAAMAESLAAGRPVEVTEVASLADSLGGGIGLSNRLTFAMCRALLDEVILVSEEEIYDGMRDLLLADRTVAEGACAVGHAAVLGGKLRLAEASVAAFVITSRNVDPEQVVAVAAGRPVSLGERAVLGKTVRGPAA